MPYIISVVKASCSTAWHRLTRRTTDCRQSFSPPAVTTFHELSSPMVE